MSVDASFDERSGRLHLITPGRAVEITGWPAPEAWVETAAGRKRCRPRLSIVGALQPFQSAAWARSEEGDPAQMEFFFPPVSAVVGAMRAYWESYPSHVVRALKSFGGDHSFHLAQWCAAGGLSVLARVPALGFMGALRSPAELAALTGLTDAELSAKLGFGYPSAEVALDIVRRVPAAVIDIGAVKLLKRLISEEKLTEGRLSALRQEKRLNMGVLGLISLEAFDKVVEPWLVSQVAVRREETFAPKTAKKIERALGLAQMVGEPERIAFGSVEEVEEYLKHMGELAGDVSARAGRRFPEPPFLDVRSRVFHLEAIRSEGALRVEGNLMRNCSGGMGDDVAAGEYYFYRMLRPERLTIRLSRGPQGLWVVDEARRLGDALAHRGVAALLAYWLAVEQGVSADGVVGGELGFLFERSSLDLACAV